MDLKCIRMPGNDETLKFISPYLQKEHIRKGADDNLFTPYGMYSFFSGIKSGKIRLYGMFDVENPVRFFGFAFFCVHGDMLDAHVMWDRHVPALRCTSMALALAVNDAVSVRTIECNIPDFNRPAQNLAKKLGGLDCGLRQDRLFNKNNKQIPCREFRVEIGGVQWDSWQQY